MQKIRWLAELGAPTIHLSIGAEPLSVEASHICVLTDRADGLDFIAQHTVDALSAANHGAAWHERSVAERRACGNLVLAQTHSALLRVPAPLAKE